MISPGRLVPQATVQTRREAHRSSVLKLKGPSRYERSSWLDGPLPRCPDVHLSSSLSRVLTCTWSPAFVCRRASLNSPHDRTDDRRSPRQSLDLRLAPSACSEVVPQLLLCSSGLCLRHSFLSFLGEVYPHLFGMLSTLNLLFLEAMGRYYRPLLISPTSLHRP